MVCSIGCVGFFFQAEDGIRDLVRSRGLGDVYKRQTVGGGMVAGSAIVIAAPAVAAAGVGYGVYRAVRRLSLIHI